MILTKAQNEVAYDKHRFRVLNCGRRWGKTTLAVEEIKGKALSKPHRIAYIAPTIQQARDIAWEMLLRELNPIITKTNESRLELKTTTLKGGETLIFLRGWEAVETLRGQQFDFLVIDEIASMRNFWMQWEEVLRPTLTDTKGEVMFISTPKGFNHFYDLYNKQDKDRDYKAFTFTSYDNPYIPKEEIDKARQELPEDRFAQEYLADFRKTTGLVYKEFNRKRHVFSGEFNKRVSDILVGVDWGYTNPAGILKIIKDTDNHFWITNEYYKTNKTTAEIIETAMVYKGYKYYPDPAEPDRNEELRRAGANIRDVSKDIEAGINSVRELFKQNRIHISVDCINLIWELETYRYPEKKSEKSEPEVPIKEGDHLCDALRYVIYNQEAFKSTGGVTISKPRWTGFNRR